MLIKEWSHVRRSPSERTRHRAAQGADAVANYLPYRIAGNLLFLAGQGPRDDKGNSLTGKVGAEVSVEEAYKRARIIGLQLLGDDTRRRWARSTASTPW